MEVIREEEQALTAKLLAGLAQVPGLTIYGTRDTNSPGFARKAGVVVFGLKGMMANRVAEELALQGGIGTRYGCHCAHILIKHLLGVPPLLQRFQRLIVTLFPGVRLPGLTRVSIGIENTAADVDTLIRVLGNIAGNKKNLADNQPASASAGTNNVKKAEVKKQMKDFTRNKTLKVYSDGTGTQ
jgi:selenocysteine lyase/cysteine desulfurase